MYDHDSDVAVLEQDIRWHPDKPHIHKCAGWSSQAYHCSYQIRPGHYWHTYGRTGYEAFDKMEALISRRG